MTDNAAISPAAGTPADSRTVVERYLAALRAGDVSAVRELFAPDATWRLDGDLPISGTWEGRDAILGEFLATARGRYEPESLEIEVTGMVVEGDRVALEWTSRARTLAGEPYENFCAAVFRVGAGRIRAVREYMDTEYAQRVAFSPRRPPERAG
jgi:uncharacterized protein (TIGR02246 family)